MLFIHELTHLALSLIAGTAFAIFFRKKILVLYAVLIGMFVDADHIFDYLLYKKSFSIDIHEFFSGRFFDIANKVILPFHGFEYAIILAILGIFFLQKDKKTTCSSALNPCKRSVWLNLCKGSVLLVLALSLFFHLIYDTVYYGPKRSTYFISYRAYHGFNHDFFWPKMNLNEK